MELQEVLGGKRAVRGEIYYIIGSSSTPAILHIFQIMSTKWGAGEKERFSAGSNFCTSKDVFSFQLHFDLFLIKRACCILLPQKTGNASKMLQSQILAHWGAMEAFPGTAQCQSSMQTGLLSQGPWTASHVCWSASPHCHFCRGELEQTQGIEQVICCLTASLRCTSNRNHKNEWGPPAVKALCMAQAGALRWSPPWWSHKGTCAVTERDKTEMQVSTFSRWVFLKKKSHVLNKLLQQK